MDPAKRRDGQPVRSARRAGTAPQDGPLVIVDEALVDVSDAIHDCGNGRWCAQCRDEIRAEALHWLRTLNVPPSERGDSLVFRPWHQHLMLANEHPREPRSR